MAEFIRLPDVAMAVLRTRDVGAGSLPPLGRSVSSATDLVVATGPDEWLAIAQDADAEALYGRLSQYSGIVVDVSGNRVRYRVAGVGACWFLAAGCAFDIDALEAGDAVSTLLARAQVTIIAEESESFLVLPRRSFAAYLENWAAAVGD